MKITQHDLSVEHPLRPIATSGGGTFIKPKAKPGTAALFPDVQLVRPKPAAELLGISLATFWRLVGKGTLTTVKLSPKLTAVRLSDIRSLIEERSKA
jgi:predicted DNA-binding transcriptional regulator AlpA